MARHNITINAEELAKTIEAFKAATANSGILSNALKSVANDLYKLKSTVIGGKADTATEERMQRELTVARNEFEQLTQKFARCSERMGFLLSLMSEQELKRLELLPADAVMTSIDGWDRLAIIQALDKRIAEFNKAHARLTSGGKKPDPGQLQLSGEEMGEVMRARAKGIATSEIVKAILSARGKV